MSRPPTSRQARAANTAAALHARVAAALGWKEPEVRTFSLQALRELVRPVDAALAEELARAIGSGSYVVQHEEPCRFCAGRPLPLGTPCPSCWKEARRTQRTTNEDPE